MNEALPSAPAPGGAKADRLTVFLVGLLLVAAVMMGWQEVADEKRLEVSSPAPEFTVEALSGDLVRSADLRGRVALLDFWASWCGPCREELPVLVRVAHEYEARGVRLLAINMDDASGQREAVDALVREVPGLGRFAALGTPPLAASYLVSVLPTLYVLDGQGRIVASRAGQVSEGELRHLVDAALAAAPPEETRQP